MFENLKKKLQSRTEKNAVKIPNLSYEKNGKVYTESVVLKRSTLPFGDWQRVYPVLNEDGSWNLMNTLFGGKRNFVKLLIIMGIIAFVLMAFAEIFTSYETLKSICEPYLKLRI